jgi:hypothetical protein
MAGSKPGRPRADAGLGASSQPVAAPTAPSFSPSMLAGYTAVAPAPLPRAPADLSIVFTELSMGELLGRGSFAKARSVCCCPPARTVAHAEILVPFLFFFSKYISVYIDAGPPRDVAAHRGGGQALRHPRGPHHRQRRRRPRRLLGLGGGQDAAGGGAHRRPAPPQRHRPLRRLPQPPLHRDGALRPGRAVRRPGRRQGLARRRGAADLALAPPRGPGRRARHAAPPQPLPARGAPRPEEPQPAAGRRVPLQGGRLQPVPHPGGGGPAQRRRQHRGGAHQPALAGARGAGRAAPLASLRRLLVWGGAVGAADLGAALQRGGQPLCGARRGAVLRSACMLFGRWCWNRDARVSDIAYCSPVIA